MANLGFSTKFPANFGIKELAGQPTNFEQQVIDGEKLHTMRVGTHWHEGRRIHMNVHQRTKQQRQFNVGLDYLSTCRRVQLFHFWYLPSGRMYLTIPDMKMSFSVEHPFVKHLARFDGLPSAEALFEWFRPLVMKLEPLEPLIGQIIHWNDTWYHPTCAELCRA
jgi:hypothetical protein